MGTKRYELTESEWLQIKDMLPPEHPTEGKRGRPAKCDNRTALNGMLWIARGGAPWRELPERYGAWQTVYSRFRKWKELGVFETIFQALSIDADFENISIDSTSCKVHQSANGGKKSENKAVGMSRGGRNTKIHTLVDGLGNPLAFMLSSGRDHDSTHAVPLLQEIDIKGSNILGDKAYGAKAIREYITSQGATYTIPPRENCDTPWSVNWHTYERASFDRVLFPETQVVSQNLYSIRQARFLVPCLRLYWCYCRFVEITQSAIIFQTSPSLDYYMPEIDKKQGKTVFSL